MAASEIDKQIGERVTRVMKERGMAQPEIADALAVSQAHVSRMCAGKNVWAASQVVAVARKMGVAPSVLLPDAPDLPVGMVLADAEIALILTTRRRDKNGKLSARDRNEAVRRLMDIIDPPD